MDKATINAFLGKIQQITFLLAVFFLPIDQTINHWFFGAFIAISIIVLFIQKKQRQLIVINKFFLLTIAMLFFIKVIGMFHSITLSYGMKEVTRAIPFALYPIAILSLKQENLQFKAFEKKVFYALVFGSIVTAIICWGNVILTLKPDDIPANKLFGWKKSGSYLTQVLDIHPPYLGLLIVASLVFLLNQIVFEKGISKYWFGIHMFASLLLLLFLFNITARNALLYLALVIIVFIVFQKRWKLLIFPAALFIVFNIIIWNHPSQYYRLKMVDMLGLSKNDKISDKRFVRLEASYNAFKINPIFGSGLGYDNELRIEQYKILNFEEAYINEHNSHNQFFEYLVFAGIIGGIIFLFVFFYFAYHLYINKHWLYLILLVNVFVSTLTESTFERVLGIQYFSLIIGLALLSYNSEKAQNRI